MTAVARAAAGATLALTLGGCIVAAIPIAASSSAIVRQRIEAKKAERLAAAATPPQAAPGAPGAGPPRVLTPEQTAPPAPANPAMPGRRASVPPEMQFLYGSGEGAALSVQAYASLTNYLKAQVAAARKGEELRQVVLSDGASLNQPHFDKCGEKPLAAVFDIDETAILNLGYEADAAQRGEGYNEERWQRWERTGADQVVAVPGAVRAVQEARKAGVVVIFNSNRSGANADATAAALGHAGLGPVVHGSTLWLKGDDGGGSGKDDRRWAIATGYCVVAMVGDQLGDFSDLFNAAGLSASTRRALAGGPEIAPLWGNGWFMLPNPVYGTARAGGFDEVFPFDMRWSDPAEEKK